MPKRKPGLDRELVSRLEQELERAIAGVVERFEDELPVGPDRPTMHLMSKAATAVLEAAIHHSPANAH